MYFKQYHSFHMPNHHRIVCPLLSHCECFSRRVWLAQLWTPKCSLIDWTEIIQLHLIHSRTVLVLKMKSSPNTEVSTGIKLCSNRVRLSSSSDQREVSNCLLHKFQEDINMHKEHHWSQFHSFWHWGLVIIPVIIFSENS